MSKIYSCPKCSSDLGMSGGQYSCWNSACDFRSYRPWINPPEQKDKIDIASDLASIIGECLNAAANGPFFVDGNAKNDPYWEYQTLLGFTPAEVQSIAKQWPNIDLADVHISELISSCFANLLGYPHRKEKYWLEYFTASDAQLAEYASTWRKSKYAQNT